MSLEVVDEASKQRPSVFFNNKFFKLKVTHQKFLPAHRVVLLLVKRFKTRLRRKRENLNKYLSVSIPAINYLQILSRVSVQANFC